MTNVNDSELNSYIASLRGYIAVTQERLTKATECYNRLNDIKKNSDGKIIDKFLDGEMAESRRTKIYDVCVPKVLDILHIARLEAEEARLSDAAAATADAKNKK